MSKEYQVLSCGNNKSFFRIIDEFWLKGGRRVAHRICTVMRKIGAKNIIVESIDPEDEEFARLQEEKAAIGKRLGITIKFEAKKFTFIDQEVNSHRDHCLQDIEKCRLEGRILGYAILVKICLLDEQAYHCYVFESVIRELGRRRDANSWERLSGHYLHVKREFDCRVLGKHYSIKGSFFAQQNGITSVCAHACMAMMLNNVKSTRQLVTCEDINKALEIDHDKQRFAIQLRPPPGITFSQESRSGPTAIDVKTVVERYNYDFHFSDFQNIKRPRFREFMYGFIESGFPSLLAFQTNSSAHVVASVGHTLNSNSWLPVAVKAYAANGRSATSHPAEFRYLSSLAWVDDFLVHDDNVGMQLNLPAHAFHDVDHYAENIDFVPKYTIGIFPSEYKIYMKAHQVERLVSEFLTYYYKRKSTTKILSSDNYYVNHLLPHFETTRRTVVLRTTLVSKLAYLRHIASNDHFSKTISPEQISYIESVLEKERYWLVEITEPDLYVGNKSKVIDVLVDPTFVHAIDKPDWPMSVRALRFPGKFISRIGQTSSFERIRLETEAHSALFRLDSDVEAASLW